MKKSLLIASAALFATAASAQEVIVAFATQEDQERVGIDGSALTDEQVAVPFVESEAGDFYLAFADTWKSGAGYDKYNTVRMNGSDDIALTKYGAVGSNNPGFISYQEGAQSSGAVFRIEAKMHGYMTVFTKLALNKAFVVMEGLLGDISYRLGYANSKGVVFQYELPKDENGYLNFSDNPDGRWFTAAQKQGKNEAGELLWNGKDGEIVAGAERPSWEVEDGTNEDGTPKYTTKTGSPYMVDIEPRQDKPTFPCVAAGLDPTGAMKDSGTVFVTFPVIGPDPEAGYLEGNTYYVSALGSKVPMGGFIYTDTEPTITYCATADLPEIVFAPGKEPVIGENSVSAIGAADVEAPIYNAQGIRVNADAKGLLIQNGKKFIRK